MIEVKLIHIGWEEHDFSPLNISQLNKSHHRGLYQIYGVHPVYGDNTLLYIGKTSEQLFSERLKNRWEFIESINRVQKICIGMIYPNEDCTENNLSQIIDLAEAILIKSHSPAYNSSNVKGLFINLEKTIILNWGAYGRLMPEISTMKVSYDYWDCDNEGYINEQ